MTISEGEYDKVDIMGKVTNTTDGDKTVLWVACVLFDKNDKPLAAYGEEVAPGKKANDTIKLTDSSIVL